MTNIKERVLQIAKKEGVTKELFFKELGLSYANFKGIQKKSALNSDSIDIILSKYPYVSPIWLISGKGDMILDEKKRSPIDMVVYDSVVPKGAVPFYNLPVSAGHSVFEIEGAMKPDGYIVDLPGIGYTEAFLPVHGYSMYPEIKEGSIIGVRTAERWDHLNTQNKYLIITLDDRMVKYIRYDKERNDILWCISPNYDDFSILKEDIVKVYRVTFVMNPE